MSMQRYWFSLDAAARRRANDLTVRCPLGSPVFPARKRSRAMWDELRGFLPVRPLTVILRHSPLRGGCR